MTRREEKKEKVVVTVIVCGVFLMLTGIVLSTIRCGPLWLHDALVYFGGSIASVTLFTGTIVLIWRGEP